MKYDYFVSYQYISRKRGYGFGQINIISLSPIETQGHILEIRDYIQKQNDFDTVVILNYKLLCEINDVNIR